MNTITPCYKGPARKYWICRKKPETSNGISVELEKIAGPYAYVEANIYRENTKALTGEWLEIWG
jgi:hypothetical protein